MSSDLPGRTDQVKAGQVKSHYYTKQCARILHQIGKKKKEVYNLNKGANIARKSYQAERKKIEFYSSVWVGLLEQSCWV